MALKIYQDKSVSDQKNLRSVIKVQHFQQCCANTNWSNVKITCKWIRLLMTILKLSLIVYNPLTDDGSFVVAWFKLYQLSAVSFP